MAQPVNIRTGQPIEEQPGLPHTPSYSDGNGGDGDMLQRVKKLEEDVQAIRTDLAVMKSNYATTTNVSDAKNSIIMWVVSAILLAQILPPLLKKFGM